MQYSSNFASCWHVNNNYRREPSAWERGRNGHFSCNTTFSSISTIQMAGKAPSGALMQHPSQGGPRPHCFRPYSWQPQCLMCKFTWRRNQLLHIKNMCYLWEREGLGRKMRIFCTYLANGEAGKAPPKRKTWVQGSRFCREERGREWNRFLLFCFD